MIAALVSIALLSTPMQDQSLVQLSDRPFVQVVFLVTGPNQDEIKDDDRAKRSTAHLSNLRKLIESGKAFAAGPVVAGGNREGIAILNAATAEDAKELFAADPWVEIGKLALDIHKWMVPAKRFGKPVDPPMVNTHAFAVISLPKDAAAEAERDAAFMTRMNENPLVAVAGLFEAGDALRALVVFKDRDKNAAANVLAADPDFKADKYRALLSQTYIHQGILD